MERTDEEIKDLIRQVLLEQMPRNQRYSSTLVNGYLIPLHPGDVPVKVKEIGDPRSYRRLDSNNVIE